MTNDKNEILEGRIFPALTKFAIPILFSLILQALYGAVDLWMVSRFGTNADVSAVSTGSQTMLIVNGIVTGLSMGITVLLGQAKGEKNDKKAADIIGFCTWIFFILAIIMTAVLLLSSESLAVLLNAPKEAFAQTKEYILICGAGTIFVVAYNVLNGIFCGLGDSRTPLIFVGIACVVNIAADYILIDVFNMGAKGAAIATISAQAVSVILSGFIIRKKLPFSIGRENFKLDKKLGLGILKLGFPIALLRMSNEISYLIIIGLVNKLGVVASSGVGIAEKLVMFILLIPTAYMSAISAFVAQNEGAGQKRRSVKTMWTGMATAAVIGGVISYISFFHGDLMSLMFINDPEVIEASSTFLKATSIECFVLSLAYCFDGYFNGIEKTSFVMLQGVGASLLIRIPYAYFASTREIPSLFNIGMASAWAAIAMLIVSWTYYKIYKHKSRTK